MARAERELIVLDEVEDQRVAREADLDHLERRIDAHDQIAAASVDGDFEFVGFVEGGDIPGNRVDVIVTDGFTGNIALKTGEGTAKLISDFMREAFGAGLMSKFAATGAAAAMSSSSSRPQ